MPVVSNLITLKACSGTEVGGAAHLHGTELSVSHTGGPFGVSKPHSPLVWFSSFPCNAGKTVISDCSGFYRNQYLQERTAPSTLRAPAEAGHHCSSTMAGAKDQACPFPPSQESRTHVLVKQNNILIYFLYSSLLLFYERNNELFPIQTWSLGDWRGQGGLRGKAKLSGRSPKITNLLTCSTKLPSSFSVFNDRAGNKY